MDFLVAQTVKCLPTMQEGQIQSQGQEDFLEKEMAIHSSILAWQILWKEEPGRLQSMGSQRVRHDWATSFLTSLSTLLNISSFSLPTETSTKFIDFHWMVHIYFCCCCCCFCFSFWDIIYHLERKCMIWDLLHHFWITFLPQCLYIYYINTICIIQFPSS